jgi:hypothetical protein
LDHRDGVRTNNRLANLREATRSENCQNAAKRNDNTSGFTGVWPVGKRWRAKVAVDGVERHAGYFATKELAQAAYLATKAELHKFQPIPRELLT